MGLVIIDVVGVAPLAGLASQSVLLLVRSREVSRGGQRTQSNEAILVPPTPDVVVKPLGFLLTVLVLQLSRREILVPVQVQVRVGVTHVRCVSPGPSVVAEDGG